MLISTLFPLGFAYLPPGLCKIQEGIQGSNCLVAVDRKFVRLNKITSYTWNGSLIVGFFKKNFPTAQSRIISADIWPVGTVRWEKWWQLRMLWVLAAAQAWAPALHCEERVTLIAVCSAAVLLEVYLAPRLMTGRKCLVENSYLKMGQCRFWYTFLLPGPSSFPTRTADLGEHVLWAWKSIWPVSSTSSLHLCLSSMKPAPLVCLSDRDKESSAKEVPCLGWL